MNYLEESRRIRQIQAEQGFELDIDFARHCGIKQTNMSQILNGYRLGLQYLKAICKATGADMWWVCTGDGDRYRKPTDDDSVGLGWLWAKIQDLPNAEKKELMLRLTEELLGSL